MNKVIQILLSILFIQLLVFLYVKFFYVKETAPTPSNTQTKIQTTEPNPVPKLAPSLAYMPKELPHSKEYTVWDEKMIAKLNKEIQLFNEEMKKLVDETEPVEVIQRQKVATYQEPKPVKNQTQNIKAQDIKNQKIKKEIKVAKKKKPKPNKSTTFKIAQFAKKKLGTKYVWGATGPNKFDCSGFTREVYKSTTGIQIPRVSRDQAKVGTYVKFSQLRRGDMVFFDTEKKYTGKVTHVGIYLSNNNFIHASSAGKKVIITNFKKKPFYKKRFLWGRRIVKS